MSKPTKTTETASPARTSPPSDQRVVYFESSRLTVFVRADGSFMLMAYSSGVSVDLTIPAEAGPAFVNAVSTPYSGGITS